MNPVTGRLERAIKLVHNWWREKADRQACVEIASMLVLCCVIGVVVCVNLSAHWLLGVLLGAIGAAALLGLAKLGGTILGRKLDGKPLIPALPRAARKQLGATLSWLFDGARGEALILLMLCTIAGGIGGGMTFGVLIGAGIGFAMAAIIVGWVGLIYVLFGR